MGTPACSRKRFQVMATSGAGSSASVWAARRSRGAPRRRGRGQGDAPQQAAVAGEEDEGRDPPEDRPIPEREHRAAPDASRRGRRTTAAGQRAWSERRLA